MADVINIDEQVEVVEVSIISSNDTVVSDIDETEEVVIIKVTQPNEITNVAIRDEVEYVDVIIKEAEDGEDGSDGASAYQIAVANGFVGTEAQWLESLKGEPGEPGPPGPAPLDRVIITPTAGTSSFSLPAGWDSITAIRIDIFRGGPVYFSYWLGWTKSGTTITTTDGDIFSDGEQLVVKNY